MAKQTSALVALKNLEKSYEERRHTLLRKAEEEMASKVHQLVGELAGIAKDFPKVVSDAIATFTHASSTPRAPAPAATKHIPSEEQGAARFRAMSVKAHRANLGLSAGDYGKLAGVSRKTIYQWESGKSKPQPAQKARWLSIRDLGKEEALKRLGTGGAKAAPTKAATKPMPAQPAAPTKQKRGSFKQTSEEMILSLLKGKKATTGELAAEWKKSGRGGTVDNILSKLVKAKKLIRKPLEGKRGSEYSVA